MQYRQEKFIYLHNTRLQPKLISFLSSRKYDLVLSEDLKTNFTDIFMEGVL